jgi:hypothetical protein
MRWRQASASTVSNADIIVGTIGANYRPTHCGSRGTRPSALVRKIAAPEEPGSASH